MIDQKGKCKENWEKGNHSNERIPKILRNAKEGNYSDTFCLEQLPLKACCCDLCS